MTQLQHAVTVRPDPPPVRWERAAVRCSLVLAGLAVALGLADPVVLERGGPVVLAIGIVVGMPHGAVDHLVPFWTGRLRSGARAMAVVLGGYLALAATVLVTLRLVGPAALLVLLALSVLHFGVGDVMSDRGRLAGSTACPRMRRLLLGCAVLARGLPAVVLPLAVWPARTDHLLRAVAPGAHLANPTIRLTLVALLIGCVVVSLVEAGRRHDPLTVVELIALLALFACVPPLAAFGVYFGGWHGLRHSARMIDSQPGNQDDLRRGRWAAPVGRFLRAAAIPTGLALTGTAALVVLAHSGSSLAASAFSALFALTVPHLIIVGALDLGVLSERPGVTVRNR